MLNLSGLTRYPKKSKTSDRYKELETNFLQATDKLFDIFCDDSKQRKQCEIQCSLGMTFNEHALFEDQKAEHWGKRLAEVSEL